MESLRRSTWILALLLVPLAPATGLAQEGVARDPVIDNREYDQQERARREAEFQAEREQRRQMEQQSQAQTQQRASDEGQARAAAWAAHAAIGPRSKVVSLRAHGAPGLNVRHRNFLAYVTPIAGDLDGHDASFRYIPGLMGQCVSFESLNYPGYFLRHENFRLKLAPIEDSEQFRADATFCSRTGLADGNEASYFAINYPTYYIRNEGGELWLREYQENEAFVSDATFVEAEPFYRD